MANGVVERRKVRLHKVGGSRSVVIPKEWLDRLQIENEADIVLGDEGIAIERHVDEPRNIEEEPEFALFMNFVLSDALSHPEALIDPTDLFSETDRLLEGVESD
jgi:hypothetical protein